MKFTKRYIKKCISAKDILDYYFSFSKGDYFHCPSLMDDGEWRQVKEVKVNKYLLTKDLIEKYIAKDCIWIPTKEQLNKILVEYNTHLKLNEEGLLDHFMGDIYKKPWDKEKEEYIK